MVNHRSRYIKTDRIYIRFTPNEKAAIAEKATHLNVTLSELIRLAVEAYNPEVSQ
ncbi:plasmid mobilization protein [Nostoc flagelliforme]|uniref:plasmid mobilization protein n=1 Tax=Nostoc flagelliforme TaxID=1306274 RepID=UPI0026B45A8B